MNNLRPRTVEQLLKNLCFVAISLVAGMLVLGIQGREDSLAFTSFDRLAILLLGGIIGIMKQSHG